MCEIMPSRKRDKLRLQNKQIHHIMPKELECRPYYSSERVRNNFFKKYYMLAKFRNTSEKGCLSNRPIIMVREGDIIGKSLAHFTSLNSYRHFPCRCLHVVHSIHCWMFCLLASSLVYSCLYWSWSLLNCCSDGFCCRRCNE